MSFQSMNLADLQAAATQSGVNITEESTKKEIISALAEANITYATYKKLYLEKPNKQESQEESTNMFSSVLLKMERQNPTFQAYGYTFTKENPYHVLSAEDAQKIIDAHQGFRIASPAEAKSFYS